MLKIFMEPFRQKGSSMASWSTFIFKSGVLCILDLFAPALLVKVLTLEKLNNYLNADATKSVHMLISGLAVCNQHTVQNRDTAQLMCDLKALRT